MIAGSTWGQIPIEAENTDRDYATVVTVSDRSLSGCKDQPNDFKK